MFKNVAGQKLIVIAFDSTTNAPKTGDAANITAYVSKDYGAVTVLGDVTATEMDATNAKGYYLFDLTQAETNGDALLFSAKSSTANIVVLGAPASVSTTPASFTSSVAQTGDAYARLGAPAGASIAADIAAAPATLLDATAGVETGRTLRQALRLILAGVCGKASGLAGTTVTFRDTNDSKDRIVATVDANGNRSAVTLDAS